MIRCARTPVGSSPSSARCRCRGWLNGSIDAVFRVGAGDGARFVVVDYKSNRLHEPGAADPLADVSPGSSRRRDDPQPLPVAGAAVQRRPAPLPAVADRRPLRPRSPSRRRRLPVRTGHGRTRHPHRSTASPTASSPGSRRRPRSSPSTPSSFMSTQIARTGGFIRHEAPDPSNRLRRGVPASWWQPSPADRRHLLACTRRP